jgi:hypothetical protein
VRRIGGRTAGLLESAKGESVTPWTIAQQQAKRRVNLPPFDIA